MRRFLVLSLGTIALAACSSEPVEQESADDFANRIGGGEQRAGLAPSQPDPDASNTASEAPPSGAELTSLQKLGDVGGVDLGPREGGCTMMVGQEEMLIAAGMRDVDMPAKAVVRVGNGLTMLDSGPGGLQSIRNGTTFSGEGFTVRVNPAAGGGRSRLANLVVTDAAGASQSYKGRWICA